MTRSILHVCAFIAVNGVLISGCASSQVHTQNDNMPPIVVAADIDHGQVVEKGDEYIIDAPAVAVPASSYGDTYTVRKGDSLSRISQKTGVSEAILVQFNGLRDPNRIYAGQVLSLTGDVRNIERAAPRNRTGMVRELKDNCYVVQAGDSLSEIAAAFKTTVDGIKSANALKGDAIRIGARLKIPASIDSASAEPVIPANESASNAVLKASAIDTNSAGMISAPGI